MNYSLSVWFNSLKQYVQMCLFLSSPAKLPANPASIILTLLAYITIGKLMLGEDRTLLSITLQIGIEVVILFVTSFTLLKIVKKPERLLQTMSALIGASLIISIISLLIMSTFGDSINTEQPEPGILEINLALLIWNLAVISLIFKRAFEIRTAIAVFITLNYFLMYEFLLLNFF